MKLKAKKTKNMWICFKDASPELPSLNLKLMVPGATIFVVSER